MKNGNITYIFFQFPDGNDGEMQMGFMVSLNGQQYMPGYYLDSNGKPKYDPYAEINSIFPSFWSGNYFARSHT